MTDKSMYLERIVRYPDYDVKVLRGSTKEELTFVTELYSNKKQFVEIGQTVYAEHDLNKYYWNRVYLHNTIAQSKYDEQRGLK